MPNKPHCSDCGGPREPDSTYYSYCKECGRARGRKRYSDNRLEAGFTVAPRPSTTITREEFLRQGDNRPGRCECCSRDTALEPYDPIDSPFAKRATTHNNLNTISLKDPDDPDAYYGTRPFALLCFECLKVAWYYTPEELNRLSTVLAYLHSRKIRLEDVHRDNNIPMLEAARASEAARAKLRQQQPQATPEQSATAVEQKNLS